MASTEPLNVALDQKGELLQPGALQLGHHLLKRATLPGMLGHRLVAGQSLTIFGDLAGAGFVLHGGKPVAGKRRTLQAENLDRHGRRRFVYLLAAIVDDGAHAAPLGARDDDIARHQRAGLHQHRGDRTTALVELGFDDDAFRGAVRDST